ncbi:MAG: His/Gly/Thr/Pro-type tRNA ligase C-terminal domain-containing protein [Anaerobacillus sp.]
MVRKNEKPEYIIIPIGAKREALIVASSYRKKGVRIEVDMTEKRIGKSMDRANKRGIEKVIFVGEKEIEKNEIVVKCLNEGTEERIPFMF